MFKNKAFTLIELLVVISIIGVLAAIVLVNMDQSRKAGKDSAIMQSLTQIKNAAELQFNNEYTYIHICDDGDPGDIANDNSLFDSNVDFVRVTQYVNDRQGVIVCRDTDMGWAVASSLNKGGCWCVDYEGRSKKLDLSGSQTCGDVLPAGMITCP